MGQTSEMVFFQGYDSARCLRLTRKDCDTGAPGPINLAPVLEVQIYFKQQFYSSQDNPGVFDWTVDPVNGRLDIKLGLITNPNTIPIGKDKKVELILIDPSNPNGLPMDDYLNVNIKIPT